MYRVPYKKNYKRKVDSGNHFHNVLCLSEAKGMDIKMKNKNTKYCDIVIIFIITALLAGCFYVSALFNTDDAGTYLMYYKEYNLGAVKCSVKEMLEPTFWISRLLFLFNTTANGARIVIAGLTFWYSICIFLTFLLMRKSCESNLWLYGLATFILLPYEGTNQYHLVAAAFSLLILLFFFNFQSTRNYCCLIIAAMVFVYGILFLSDRISLLLYTLIPMVIYAIIKCVQDSEKRYKLYIGALILAVLTVLIKAIDIIIKAVSGNQSGLLGAWSGYGGESYLTWIDIYDLFDKGIPAFFECLRIQYNIPMNGGMIQINSFYWIIRMIIVGLMLIAITDRWYHIFKHGLNRINCVDSVTTITVTSNVLVNVFNGIIKYYSISETPMNRYASVVWFLLVIILVRWIQEKYHEISIYANGKITINSSTMLGFIFLFLIVGYMEPIYLGRDSETTDACWSEWNYLKEQDGYNYGIGSFWRSTPIIAMTNGEYNTCAGWISVDEQDPDKLVLKCNDVKELYEDGSNQFNYIISAVGLESTMNQENIERLWGDYEKKQYIDNDRSNSIIYLYDYDIRFEPKVIMESVGTDYELIDPIEYYFDFPVGTNRIEMRVGNSSNFNLNVVDNPDISDVSITLVGDNKIYVDLVCTQNTSVVFHVARYENVLTTIHKISLKRVKAAIDIDNIEEVYLNAGEYIFTFAGQGLHDLQVEWSGDNIETERLTDGRIRNRYRVKLDKAQNISFKASGDDVQIDRITYENADLFNSN